MHTVGTLTGVSNLVHRVTHQNPFYNVLLHPSHKSNDISGERATQSRDPVGMGNNPSMIPIYHLEKTVKSDFNGDNISHGECFLKDTTKDTTKVSTKDGPCTQPLKGIIRPPYCHESIRNNHTIA